MGPFYSSAAGRTHGGSGKLRRTRRPTPFQAVHLHVLHAQFVPTTMRTPALSVTLYPVAGGDSTTPSEQPQATRNSHHAKLDPRLGLLCGVGAFIEHLSPKSATPTVASGVKTWRWAALSNTLRFDTDSFLMVPTRRRRS